MTELPHPRIDAHLHLWTRTPSDYTWVTPELGQLDADFVAADALEQLWIAGIDSAILVQADDTLADTRSMIAVAAENPWVDAVVGWVPIDAPARAELALSEWLESGVVRGIRQLLHTDPRDGLLDDPRAVDTLRLVADAGLAYDVPDAWPRLLPAIPRLAASVPDLRIVIDHLGKPPRASGEFEAWREAMRDAAAHPTAVAKLSGLQGYSPDEVRRAWSVALDTFGPDRLLYGGDWPMTVVHGGYSAVWHFLSGLIAELSPAEQVAILSGTARRVYRLGL